MYYSVYYTMLWIILLYHLGLINSPKPCQHSINNWSKTYKLKQEKIVVKVDISGNMFFTGFGIYY